MEKGNTQQEIACVFNVKAATVSRWEAGLIQPDYLMLVKIAQFFEVSADYLLGLED